MIDTLQLPIFVSYTNLVEQLSYLHTTSQILIQPLDKDKKNVIYIFYTKENKTYNFYFTLNDEKVLNTYLRKNSYLEFWNIKNKELFLQELQKQVNNVIESMKHHWYKFEYKPSVTISDLENLDEIFNSDDIFEELITQTDNKEQDLSTILLTHNIMQWDLLDRPYFEGGRWIITIKNITPEHVRLVLNKEYKSTNISIECYPNILFPDLINIKLQKNFSYQNTNYVILYQQQLLTTQLLLLAKKYYNQFKVTQLTENAVISKKFLEIIQNPYTSDSLAKWINTQVIYQKSGCPKCGSKSNMFKIHLWDVHVKMFLSSSTPAIIIPKNIIDYKSILNISCSECNNVIINNQQEINKIQSNRTLLWKEDWTNSLHSKPLLDDPVGRDVIVIYDELIVECEFDTSNTLYPKLVFSDILEKWSILWWIDIETREEKMFINYDK